MNTIEKKTKEIIDVLQSGNKAVILYGVPGTPKLHIAFSVVYELLKIGRTPLSKFRYEPMGISNERGCWEILQFHAGYNYSNFVGESVSTGSSTSYRRGAFQTMCKKAVELRDLNSNKENTPKLILIIENIDKVDISAVFGEMLFGIRNRNMNVTTPFTRNLYVPDNLYIIGTMECDSPANLYLGNEAAETFTFVGVQPSLDCINEMLAKTKLSEDVKLKYVKKCIALNSALENLAKTNYLLTDLQLGEDVYARITQLIPANATDIDQRSLDTLWNGCIVPCIATAVGGKIKEQEVAVYLEREKKYFCS